MQLPFTPTRLARTALRLLTRSAAREPDRAGRWQRAGLRWWLDLITFYPDDAVVVGAWVVAPEADVGRVVPVLNGRPPDHLRELDRTDLDAAYPFLPGIGHAARRYVATFRLHPEELAPGSWLAVGPGDHATGRRTADSSPTAWRRVPAPGDPPIPTAAQAKRVQGTGDEAVFLTAGATAFGALRDALRSVTGRDVGEFPRVLDWGCGCGRVTRYFRDFPVRATGVDVDAENAAWAAANLPFAEFRAVPLHPPTGLPDAAFDLAIGVSVFTHLTEPAQNEWLAELRRVVRPGGVLLMTFHGESAVVAAGLPAGPSAVLARRGILDGPNTLYDANLPEPDYYRNTYHTAEYVRRVWGKWFDVLAVLPGHLFLQDVAVLRRR